MFAGLGMALIGLVIGGGVAFFLLGAALAGTSALAPHLVLLFMGVLSAGLTVGAPKAWWLIGLSIGLPSAVLVFGPPWWPLAETGALALAPAFLSYWLASREG